MTGQSVKAIRFWRGRKLYQVTHAYEGEGFIGLCDGRIVAKAPDQAGVARVLIMAARWREQKK